MRSRSRPASLLVIAALGAALAGCGGDDDGGGDEIPGGADQVEARVIEEWSTALREGDVEGAADHFALPAIAQNGTPALSLESREDVIAFNESLPCGAELIGAEDSGDYTIATFELTERPGAGECGDGVGATAKTAFGIRDGKIERWIRVVDDDAPLPPESGPVV